MEIRNYLPGDAAKLVAICKNAPEAAQWPAQAYERAHSYGQIILVAEAEGRVAGFVVARAAGDEAEILNMAVENAERRKGVGQALLSGALEEARGAGCKKVFLEVREGNATAIAFYRQYRFCEIGKRTGYYRDPTEDATLMQKRIED